MNLILKYINWYSLYTYILLIVLLDYIIWNPYRMCVVYLRRVFWCLCELVWIIYILTHHEARISSEIIKRRNKIRNKTLETKLRVNIYPIACRFMDKQIAGEQTKVWDIYIWIYMLQSSRSTYISTIRGSITHIEQVFIMTIYQSLGERNGDV